MILERGFQYAKIFLIGLTVQELKQKGDSENHEVKIQY